MSTERISLFCKEGRSDKEYHLQLEPLGDAYVVNYQHGRRGGPLTSGTKTPVPVPYAQAKKIYDAKVKEQLGKRYKPGPGTSSGYAMPIQPERFTGVLPQLLHAVPEGEEGPYLDSPDWIMQQKHDGERRPVKTAAPGEPITGINRKGEAVGLSKAAAAEIAALAVPHLVLDAEAVGDRLLVFDLLEYGGTDIRAWPFARRHRQLREVLAALSPSSVVELVPVYITPLEKRLAFEKLRARGAEGVVFKLASAPYESGRPPSGGPAMKFKFWHEASVLVEQVNAGKRSVTVSVLSPTGARVDIGSVTIPANQDIPKAGAILEVRYLYAFLGGSLYQTTSKGVRDDIEPSECTQDQLVYKRAEELDYTMSPAPA